MRILAATWPNVAYQGRVLTLLGANNRLVSFWFSREMSEEAFETYCRTGIPPEEPKRSRKRPDVVESSASRRADPPPWEEDDDLEEVVR